MLPEILRIPCTLVEPGSRSARLRPIVRLKWIAVGCAETLHAQPTELQSTVKSAAGIGTC
jgi:hypothetical protein